MPGARWAGLGDPLAMIQEDLPPACLPASEEEEEEQAEAPPRRRQRQQQQHLLRWPPTEDPDPGGASGQEGAAPGLAV